MQEKLTKIKIYFPIIIFLLAFVWRLWGINSQGETWDEIAYYNAGHSYAANLKNFDFDSDHWNFNKEHPPLAKYFYALVSFPAYLNNTTDYTNGRILSAFLGALTVLIVFFLTRELFSNRHAVIASLVLIFMPILVGLNKVFGLDSPTILFYTLTLYLFILAIKRSSTPLYLLTGLSLGMAIATRYNNFLLFGLLPIIFLILKGKELWQGKERNLLWFGLIIPSIAILFLFLSWPWLWSNTIVHWQTTIGHWGGIKELFFGKLITPGYSYYFVYLLITTPVIILILSLFFLPQLFLSDKKRYLWVVFAWFLSLFLVTCSPTKQNGMRYIAAIYPPLAIMVSIGFFAIFKKNNSIYFATIALFIYLVTTNLTVHPYYLTYFNELIGGTKKVVENKWFPVGYWGDGVEEACIWLSNDAKQNAKVFINSSPDHTTGNKLRSDLIKTADNPDYIITNLSKIWYNNYMVPTNYSLVHTSNTNSVPFVFVYKRN